MDILAELRAVRKTGGDTYSSSEVLGMVGRAADEIERLREREDRLAGALHQIDSWSRAYPLEVFPEPDLKRARDLLAAGGVTLDAISAHCMRHVVEGVGKIARDALA